MIVWDNSKRPVDRGVYGRYEALAEATNDVIYWQDDDIIFTNHDALLAAYEPGRFIVNMNPGWRIPCGYFDLGLGGMGSLCDKDIVKPVFDRWFAAYPETEGDNFIYECDFVFGVLVPFTVVDLGYEILDCARADNRLWTQDWQMDAKWDFIRRARGLRKICLTMMVKNEADHIYRAIKSCKGLVDYVCIMDTGSTDDTLELATRACDVIGVDYTVYLSEWVNFGHNRNELVDLATRHGDYLLLMDGDETFEWGEVKREWPELSADAYYFYYAGETSYAQPRLIRSGVKWRYTPGVHSTIEPLDQDINPVLLKVPLIKHWGAERHIEEKLETDAVQLIQMMHDEPTNGRTAFHLGKALEGLGHRREALETYRRRVVMGGWDEEVWYCKYRQGMLECSEISFELVAL